MADSELQFGTQSTSHQGRLFAYVLSMVGHADQARDVMQTAYYQVMAHRTEPNSSVGI